MILPLLLGALVSSSYVAAIRIAVPEDVKKRERNDPVVIWFRFKRILWLCLALAISIPLFTALSQKPTSIHEALINMGLIPGLTRSSSLRRDLMNVGASLLKICTLYIGPICAYILIDLRHWRADLAFNFATMTGIRDHVFAPITEEFVYRAVLWSILDSHFQERSLILYSPLLFGIAHVHHGFSLYFQENASLASSVLTSGFQLVYTSLFGIMANTFYVKSGYNLWCPIAVHATCNLLGFPSFDMKQSHPRFFIVYCALLAFGVFAFWRII